MGYQITYFIHLIFICALFAATVYLLVKSAVKSAIKEALNDEANQNLLRSICLSKNDDKIKN